MNSEFLLSALSRFGDHPDRIQEFRKVIVGLAISGRLDGENEQNSPSELMEAIEAHKAELFARREIAKPKRYSAITDEQLPTQFVDASTFVALGSIARIEKGLTGIQQAQPGPHPLVVTAAERSTCDHFDFEGPAAIIPLVSSTGHGHASINRLHYQEGEFALGTILAAVVPFAPELISARFLFEYLSTFKDELLVTRMTGTANVTLSIGRIAEVPVPLVPPAAQRKVDELMALCDQLEEARAEREMDRDKLTLSTLAKLNEPDPETFTDDVGFALKHLEPLTKRTDQIKQLRQTILNLAVHGKLVAQDPNDEPASEQLLRIGQAKSASQKAKQTTREAKGTGAPDYIEPLPSGWAVSTLGELALSMRYGTSIKCERDMKGAAVLRIPNVSNGKIDLGDLKFGPLKEKEQAELALEAGDLLMIRSNGSLAIVGRSAVVTHDAEGMSFAGYLVRVRLLRDEINPHYLWLSLNSSDTRDAIEVPIRSAVGLKNVNLTEFGALRIPLPPLAEQHRIMAKVDELMALCDQLEASLTESEQTRSKLLEAVLHQALEPA